MKRFFLICSLLVIATGIFAQSRHKKTGLQENHKTEATSDCLTSDSLSNADTLTSNEPSNIKMILPEDSLTLSDFMMSIERVTDNLNAIRDSSRLSFEVVDMSRRVNEISEDIKLIRQNVRDRNSVINIKNLYLYQSFAVSWDKENSRIRTRINEMYNRMYNARIQLKTVLSDSVFRKLYADSSLHSTFERRLSRLEKKWARADSSTKTGIDSLNSLKFKIADNSVSLSSMLNIMDRRLDKSVPNLFGPEVNCLWQKASPENLVNSQNQKTQNLLGSELKAMGYYFSETSRKRTFIIVLGIILFTWLFFKRKLLKLLREQKVTYSYLHIQYLDNHPILSLLVLLLCLMPFFDAYAPTSYVAIEYVLLITSASIIFFRSTSHTFRADWLTLVILFFTDILIYLLIKPTFSSRMLLLAIHVVTIIFILRFIKNLNKEKPYYKWLRRTSTVGIISLSLAIVCNIFGRFSLSGILGIAGISAVVQAIVLPVFVDTVLEFILLQLQGSRMRKGVDKPFDCSVVIKKIKKPLIIIAFILWIIMLASNLNIYHNLSKNVEELLTTTRAIGSISYRLISVLMFFIIIWSAHIMQRLVGFIFGETGIETEDLTTVSKGQHSRLLITRLLVLIGGYLLAIAASGLPIDKLTIVLGALGVGIGMGLQNVVNNFVSGIILIFDGSLQIGDEIEVNGQAGKVKEIGLRAITLNTVEGAEVIIPNGHILSQNIVNWTFSNDQKRVNIWFTLSGKELDSNVINEIINNAIKNIPNVVSQKKPVILYNRVAQGTCTITVRFWSTITNADNVKSEAMLQLSTAFAARNIGFE